jgi:hypothetical protein
VAARTIAGAIGGINLALTLEKPRKIPIAARPLHDHMPGAAPAIFAVMMAVILAFGNTAPSYAQHYTVDHAESASLTRYLHDHNLPLAAAQVADKDDGSRRVMLYGFVATDSGRSDAEDMVRRYLNNPAPSIVDRVVVRPEIGKLGSSQVKASPSSERDNPKKEENPGTESLDKVFQDIQRYGVHGAP